MFSWKMAVLAAGGLGALGLLARPRSHRWVVAAACAREGALILALYAVWQVTLDVLVTRVTGAFSHALWLWRLERTLHLPSEVTVQRWVLPHPLLVKAANYYYVVAHYQALIAFLIWLYVRHRDRYSWGRGILVLATGASLFLQAIPVAPPRMFTGLGFVDTGALYGLTVYGSHGRTDPGQLIAMPSVHVVWSVLIALVVITVSHSRWRWLVLAHPAMTVTAVVVTGNHWWMDAIVAAILVALAAGALAAGAARSGRHNRLTYDTYRSDGAGCDRMSRGPVEAAP